MRLRGEEGSGRKENEEDEDVKQEKIEVKKQKFSWNEESIEIFKAQTADVDEEEKAEDAVEKRWKEAKDMVEKAAVKKELKRKVWRLGDKKWWDKE